MKLWNCDDFSCTICCSLLGEGPRCPRMLSCGHTYCHACLEKLLVGPKPLCPTCKGKIWNQRAELIPINYIVKSFIKKMAVQEPHPSGDCCDSEITRNIEATEHQSALKISSLTKTSAQRQSKYLSEGYCEEHESFKFLRCMTCSIWVCAMCTILSHKQCRTLLVAEALMEMKDGVCQLMRTERELQKSETSVPDRLIKFFEDKRKGMTKSIRVLQQKLRNEIAKFKAMGKCLEKLISWKTEQNKYCDKLESLDTVVLKSLDYSDFTKVTNSIENYVQVINIDNLGFQIQKEVVSNLNCDDLKLLCEQESVYSCRYNDERTQYGKVAITDGSAWVHCFHSQEPDKSTVMIPFRQLLSCGELTTLPQKAFLKMGCEGSDYGDVVIATDGLSPKALNFLLLCAGINGHSYKGCQLLYNDERSEATFRFTVPNFSQLNKIVLSSPCFVGNMSWRIYIQPTTNKHKQKYMGFYLMCDGTNNSVSWSCKAKSEFRLLSVQPRHGPYKRMGEDLFKSGERSWGYPTFISWDDVLDPKKGYMKDDTITLEAWVSIDASSGISINGKKHIGYIESEMKNQGSDASCGATADTDKRSSFVKAFRSDGVCEAPTKGFVYGLTGAANEVSPNFSICIEDASSAQILGKFGEVKYGMDVLQKVQKDLAAGKRVTIKDCGLIL